MALSLSLDKPRYATTKTKEASRGWVDRENPQADGAALESDRGPDQIQARARAGKTAPRGEIRELLMPIPITGQIRVGIIGAGLIGQLHSIMLRYVADRTEQSVRVVSVADVSHSAAESLAARWQGARALESAEEIIADPSIDAVWICTPTALHRTPCIAAAAPPKHIFSQH